MIIDKAYVHDIQDARRIEELYIWMSDYYGAVSVADFLDLLNMPFSKKQTKIGWKRGELRNHIRLYHTKFGYGFIFPDTRSVRTRRKRDAKVYL